jgi:hypothetical protein
MTKVVNLKAYQLHKKQDRVKHIRETILRATGRRLTDDEIFDIYRAAVFVSDLSKGKYNKKVIIGPIVTESDKEGL